MAASMISRATVVPPTSSATMSISGSATTSRQSVGAADLARVPRAIPPTSTDRLQTAATRNGNPSFSWICSALPARISNAPEPTLPNPMIPTFTPRTLAMITTVSLCSASFRAAFIVLVFIASDWPSDRPIQRGPAPASRKDASRDKRSPAERQAAAGRDPEAGSRTANLQEARQLVELSQALQKDHGTVGRAMCSASPDIHKTEEIEKLAKRIRSRMRGY